MPVIPISSKNPVLDEVIKGLSKNDKSLPTHLLYDERGSELFEEIMALEDYYPSRTEIAILNEHAAEIAQILGEHPLLIEYGAGNSLKTRALLDNIKQPAVYMPLDISQEILEKSSAEIKYDYPKWTVLPVNADFTDNLQFPKPPIKTHKTTIFFSGSTIGNFEVPVAVKLLKKMAIQCGADGYILIGVDLVKERNILLRAYNDRKGVTAEFNLNILKHLNRTVYSNFEPTNFRHRAIFDEAKSRIVMQLLSNKDQVITIGEFEFNISKDEAITTEYSHKYSVESFGKLVAEAGLVQRGVWIDKHSLFSLQLLSLNT